MRVVVPSLAVLLSAALPVLAVPLEPAACDALKSEREKVATADLKADFAKGADWAKANLKPERLKEVQKLLELEEQIAFRCPRPKPVVPPNAAKDAKLELDPEGLPITSTAPEKPGSKAGDEKPATEKKEKPEKKKATTKTKPKVKVEDAYVPPAAGENSPPTKAQ